MKSKIVVVFSVWLFISAMFVPKSTFASVSASASTEARGVNYTFELFLDQNKVIAQSDLVYTGKLVIVLLASNFNSTMDLSVDLIKLKLINKEKYDLITSLWLDNATGNMTIQKSHPSYTITVPFQFSPHITPTDSLIRVKVDLSGTYEGYSTAGDIIRIGGTLALITFDTNIEYVINKDAVETTPGWIALLPEGPIGLYAILALTTIIILVVGVRKLLKKRVNKEEMNHL